MKTLQWQPDIDISKCAITLDQLQQDNTKACEKAKIITAKQHKDLLLNAELWFFYNENRKPLSSIQYNQLELALMLDNAERIRQGTGFDPTLKSEITIVEDIRRKVYTKYFPNHKYKPIKMEIKTQNMRIGVLRQANLIIGTRKADQATVVVRQGV